ncbi:MAG: DNA topoisomerase [Catonella sp.]|uniref:DNA topoisomerase n=1 Tax=Catonella sp. TaxID=2382125 RepID=UPI003F9FFA38
MGKTLIITEKPSVAGEYADILGVPKRGQGAYGNGNYIITWCVGHLIEMCYPGDYDEKYNKWKLEDLPFLPQTYKYAVIPNVKKQYDIVNKLMNSTEVDKILYAGDSGREGEVIIRLIRNFGGIREGIEERRVWIDSFTEDEIKRGINEAKPISAYDNLASAGIMRGIEDYAMGINFSRALSVKYGWLLNNKAGTKKYSAIAIGRVMTCVLGMVVRREREIRNFVQTNFYKISGEFGIEGANFLGEWKSGKTSKYFESLLLYNEKGFKKKDDAEKLITELDISTAVVIKKDKTSEKKKAPLLFNLAELQAECTKRFHISPDDTLKAVQTLYESKLTTYPRTDARVITKAVASEITKNLSGLYAYKPVSEFVLKIRDEGLYKGLEKTQYVDDKKVTDHYAIIPTGSVSELSKQSELNKKIYDLITRRFLAIFYPPAIYEKVSLVTGIKHKMEDFTEEFFSYVKVLKEKGYLEVMGLPVKEKAKKEEGLDKDDEADEVSDNEVLLALLSKLKKGSPLLVNKLDIKEGKTTPPKRYTSGSMILAMENAGQLIEDEELRATIKGAGIGTSATRAGIIEKLVKIGYLALNKKTQILTPMLFGEMVYEVADMAIPAMLNPEMTASWEKGLAKVEAGEITAEKYEETLNTYVRGYVENIKMTNLVRELENRLDMVKKI